MDWYVAVLKKYTVFTGRARRKEYWMFFLFNVIIAVVLSIVGELLKVRILSTIYNLAVLVPAIAVGIRRMHDVGKSGWFLLIPIYNLILAVTEGDKGDNSYGADPKAATAINTP